jgi:hypothetical protein
MDMPIAMVSTSRIPMLSTISTYSPMAYVPSPSIGLKNAGDIVPDVTDQMEWSVQE